MGHKSTKKESRPGCAAKRHPRGLAAERVAAAARRCRKPVRTALIERVIEAPETTVKLTDRGRELTRQWQRMRAKIDNGLGSRLGKETLAVLRERLAQLVAALGELPK